MTNFYIVKNWERFQHYKDRNPPWIKLHFELLSSEAWVMSDDTTRSLMMVCMLIASRNDGKVPSSAEYVKRVGYLKRTPNFKRLIELGFLEIPLADASVLQADARPETYSIDRDREEATHLTRDPPNDTKTKFQIIYDSGCAVFPFLATANTASIHQWIAAGCDAELDIIPEIKRHARADKAVRAWSYFSAGIMDAKAKRNTPLPEGKPHGTSHSRSPQPTKDERARAAVVRGIEALEYSSGKSS